MSCANLKLIFVASLSAVLGACAPAEYQKSNRGFDPASVRAKPSYWDTCQCRQARQPAASNMSLQSTGGSRQVFVLGDVLFDFNKATLRPASREVLDEVSEKLKQDQSLRAVVVGHTDSVGSDGYNVRLSRRRSDSVHDALVNSGISPTRVDIEFYGEGRPVASNDSEAGRQLNRRVEVIVAKD